MCGDWSQRWISDRIGIIFWDDYLPPEVQFLRAFGEVQWILVGRYHQNLEQVQ